MSEHHSVFAIFSPIWLQDLRYVVRNQADKTSKIEILKGVSGVLQSGLMTALVRA